MGRRVRVRVRKSSRSCRCWARGEEKHSDRANGQRTSFRPLEVARRRSWTRNLDAPVLRKRKEKRRAVLVDYKSQVYHVLYNCTL